MGNGERRAAEEATEAALARLDERILALYRKTSATGTRGARMLLFREEAGRKLLLDPPGARRPAREATRLAQELLEAENGRKPPRTDVRLNQKVRNPSRVIPKKQLPLELIGGE